ncbi:MAG: hypothetical protein K1X75_17600 [Leptospirales bacterium]|nr:hypothetical protein [Leptospirales bacterium]
MLFFAIAAPGLWAGPNLQQISSDIVTRSNTLRTNPRSISSALRNLLSAFDGNILTVGTRRIQMHEGASAVQEALDFVGQQATAPPLQRCPALERSATRHARDQSSSGALGHEGSDGSSPFDRMMREGVRASALAENISYGILFGDDGGLAIALQFLIDDGVPERGHRANMFNQEFRFTGAACAEHSRYSPVCVVDFSNACPAN